VGLASAARSGYAQGMWIVRGLIVRGRGLLLGVALLSSIGSCELPKPHIPSIGEVPAAPGEPAVTAAPGEPAVTTAAAVERVIASPAAPVTAAPSVARS
jgi:hypothetical protein